MVHQARSASTSPLGAPAACKALTVLTSADRAEIAELVVDYAYAVDEGAWSSLAALFTSDATIDYSSAGGIVGTPEEIVAWLPEALALFDWTLHSVSTHRVRDLGDDEAAGEVHVEARHGLVWEGVEERMDVTATYQDRYLRTEAGWRIASRTERTLAITGGSFAALADAARRPDRR